MKFSVFVVFLVFLLAFALSNKPRGPAADATDECECLKDDCGCCAVIQSNLLHLNDTACLNITYIPATISLSLLLSVDGKVWINETVSALDPDVCVPIPIIDYVVDVCLQFYNVQINDTDVSGCVKLELEVLDINVGGVDLGCFHFPVLTNKELIFALKKRTL